MLVTAFAPSLYGRLDASAKRSGAVTRRNIAALPNGYWIVMLSGFAEPVLYLFSIGLGVGKLVGTMTLPDGRSVPYAVYVAPAMLAASAMSGALSESTFNFFGKMKFMKLYDGVLATPVRPMEVALGELMWALARGSLYSAAFLVLMAVMHLTSWAGAVAALPATLLVGLAFGGLGLGFTTYLRGWQEFDLIATGQLALFLFSGTFAPLAGPLRWIVPFTPLYHGVELVRGITTGSIHPILLVHIGYLAALAVAGLWLAGRRMGRLLLK